MAMNEMAARATAQVYLEQLFGAAGWPVTPDMVPALVEHVRANTAGVQVLGARSNRLRMEFDLDADIVPHPETGEEATSGGA